MLGYLARRLAMTIPTLLLVAVAVFTLVRLIPGDPVQVMLGDNTDAAQAAALRAQLGLDQPVPLQFLYWLGHLATGDLGHSITNNLPVLPLILESFGHVTLSGVESGALAASALVGSAIGALIFGVLGQKGRVRFYGLDVSEEMLTTARDRVAAAGLSTRITLA